MTRYKSISILALTAAIALRVSAAPGGFAITTAQIAAAIGGAGMTISPQQVTLMSEVVARTSTPTLRVESMKPWGDHRMKVRLNCASSEECLPFLVAVHCSDENTAQLILADSVRSSTAASRPRSGSNSIVLRAGSPAILLLDGDHMHIELSVICLENGAIGQTVRVSSKDHRQTYTAEVVDGSVLKGKL